jgi:fatty acid desaturase
VLTLEASHPSQESRITVLKLAILAQLIVALSVVYVWVVRLPNIEQEFREYGIPDLLRNAVGASKIALATLLITGIWYPALVLIPALLMAFLMLCAQYFHFKAKHPWQKYMPSLALLLLSLFIAAVYSGKVPA